MQTEFPDLAAACNCSHFAFTACVFLPCANILELFAFSCMLCDKSTYAALFLQ